jgi:glycosyltransferase involved in cell wall biosynthesis
MRTVLMITYYFPPAGGPGVQRMLKFAKYLPDFGWTPAVLTVREDAAYPVRDPSLARDIPPGTRVCRTGITEFYRLYRRVAGTEAPLEGNRKSEHEGGIARVLRLARAGLFVPDGRIGWVPHALGPGTRFSSEVGAMAIVSSGPPFTANLIGGLISRRTHLPWVQDLRDPWTRAPFYPDRPPLIRRLDERLEHWTLRHADRTVAVNRGILEDFRARYSDLSPERLVTIPNGFDPADFEGVPRVHPEKLTLVHTGTIHASRDPAALRAALADLVREEEGFAAGFEIIFAGRPDGAVAEAFRAPPFDRITRFLGYVEHGVSLRLLRAADICLLLIGDEPQARGMLTGKIFEYLGSGTPILAIAPTDGEAAETISRCRCGWTHAPDDVAGLRERIRDLWRRRRAGERTFAEPNSLEVARFSRRNLTGDLAALLEAITSRRPD